MNRYRLTARWTALRLASVFVCLLALGVAGPGLAEASAVASGDSAAEGSLEHTGATQDPEEGAPAEADELAERREKIAEELGADVDEQARIAEALANPLSYLWLVFQQNDTFSYDGDALEAIGEDAQTQNTFLLQPVMSLQLTEKWKTIIRPVIPIHSFKVPDNVNVSVDNPGQVTGIDLDRETGLGDIVLWTAFSKNYTPPFVWGFGPTIMLDTASDDLLGSGKNSAGPMFLTMKITDKWIYGAVAQHWWSFSGDDTLKVSTNLGPVTVERPDVTLTDVQPILRYRLSPKTNLGLAPNWRYNWETDEVSIPLGMGYDTLVKFGKLPVKVGVEAYHYISSDDDFGADWQVRFLFVPVVPAPGFSRKPMFGGN